MEDQQLLEMLGRINETLGRIADALEELAKAARAGDPEGFEKLLAKPPVQ
jgi:hypothetical protein